METNDSAVNESVGTDIVMGNDVSQTEGGDPGTEGELIHKVGTDQSLELPDGNFVISHPVVETSVDPKKNSDVEVDVQDLNEKHSQNTLKIRGCSEQDSEAENHNTSPVKKSEEDAVLLEQCKALITEAADRALKRSLSKQQKTDQVTDLDATPVNDVVEQVEIVEQRKTSSVQSLNELVVDTNPSGDTGSETVQAEQTVVVSETAHETVPDLEIKTKDDKDCCVNETNAVPNNKEISETIKSQTLKSKDKTINDIEREVIESVNGHLDESLAETVSRKSDKKSSKGNIFTNMFKFSKKKSKSDFQDKSDTKCVSGKDKTPVEASTSAEIDNKPSTSINGQCESIAEVKRLDSLDSGIVDEKAEQQNDAVEYAVVQKKKDEKSEVKTENTEIIANPVVGQRLAEPLYINGDKTDEDFVYINERAVDVDGLDKQDMPDIVEILPEQSDETSKANGEKKQSDDEGQSTVSSDSGTGMGNKPAEIVSPQKAKLKKKTWSFQFGKKKTSPKSKELESSPVSMDPSASPVEGKKSRWGFSKFSFRKTPSDISASTPNLHHTEIPEEDAESPVPPGGKQKKKSKLKLPKLRKDKKKEILPEPVEAVLEKRSSSLTDLANSDGSPRSRKSIVEEDLNIPQTDAFEGVSLSDLDQEGDVAVSDNPDYSNAKPRKDQTGKKTSKKGSETKPLTVPTTLTEATGSQEALASAEQALLPAKDESDDKPVVEDQVYANQIVVEENRKPDNENDEYVNIASTAQMPVEDNVEHQIIQDTEYAVIAKKKQKDLVDEINEVLQTKAECEEKEESKLTETVVIENATTQGQDIIEPPTDFKDDGAESLENEQENTETQAQSYINMTYSNESFQETIANIRNPATEESKIEDSDKEIESVTIAESSIITENHSNVEPIQEKEENGEMETEIKEEDSFNEEVSPKQESSQNSENSAEKDISDNRVSMERAQSEIIIVELKPLLSTPIESTPNEITDNIVTDKAVVAEAMPEADIPKIQETVVESSVDPIQITAELHNNNEEKRMKLMKDAGVQAPDIYIPLDIDKDFNGASTSEVKTVSIGIQVEIIDMAAISEEASNRSQSTDTCTGIVES